VILHYYSIQKKEAAQKSHLIYIHDQLFNSIDQPQPRSAVAPIVLALHMHVASQQQRAFDGP
jgi:hypothetical protein